jgi:hypothetical protein
MKKGLIFIVLMITGTLAFSQKSIDNLFDKYAGKDGFTTVTINGNLLKLAHLFGDNDEDDALPVHISEIRILAQENEHMKVDNFYNAVMEDIDLKNYDEFMRVKKSDQDLRMLVRSDGERFREFLLIAGGEDNAVIQIKGNMTYSEAKKFSKDIETHNGTSLTGNHRN